jgi:uncharacterized protein YaaW (UPF0174 family)
MDLAVNILESQFEVYKKMSKFDQLRNLSIINNMIKSVKQVLIRMNLFESMECDYFDKLDNKVNNVTEEFIKITNTLSELIVHNTLSKMFH